MSKQPSVSEIKTPADQTPLAKPVDIASAVESLRRMYRPKPLIVSCRQMTDAGKINTSFGEQEHMPSDWFVEHAGLKFIITAKEFDGMYEVMDVGENESIGAGLPDLEPGSRLERDGKRLLRVVVHAGKGSVAYWKDMASDGGSCGYQVTADMVDNVQASHRVGRFVEVFEGKPGGRTWVELS